MDCSLPAFSVCGDSPGKNTGVGFHAFLQAIFLTQGSNPDLPYCRRILKHLSHQGSPRILEWVAYSFCSGSSQPRNWTRVSCVSGGFFTSWATREAHITWRSHINIHLVYAELLAQRIYRFFFFCFFKSWCTFSTIARLVRPLRAE